MNTSNFSKEQRLAALKKLPPSVQELIMSDELVNRFHEILKKNNLRVIDADVVADETNLLLFGLIRPHEFSTRITSRLANLDSAKIQAIINDVNSMVLRPIRERLKMLQTQVHKTEPGPALGRPENNPPSSTPPDTGNTEIRGIERTMQRDVASVKAGIPTPPRENTPPTQREVPFEPAHANDNKLTAQKNLGEDVHYIGGDPYREKIE